MAGPDLFLYVGGCFADYRELVSYGTSDELRLLERGAVQSTNELGDRIGGLDDIPRYSSSRRIEAPRLTYNGVANQRFESILGDEVNLTAE